MVATTADDAPPPPTPAAASATASSAEPAAEKLPAWLEAWENAPPASSATSYGFFAIWAGISSIALGSGAVVGARAFEDTHSALPWHFSRSRFIFFSFYLLFYFSDRAPCRSHARPIMPPPLCALLFTVYEALDKLEKPTPAAEAQASRLAVRAFGYGTALAVGTCGAGIGLAYFCGLRSASDVGVAAKARLMPFDRWLRRCGDSIVGATTRMGETFGGACDGLALRWRASAIGGFARRRIEGGGGDASAGAAAVPAAPGPADHGGSDAAAAGGSTS